MKPVDLQDLSGLSAKQVARLIGVNPRTVSRWNRSGLVPKRHARRLEKLQVLIKPLGDTPAARKKTLLASDTGTSLYHQMVRQVPKDQVIQHSLPVRALLGIN